MHEGDHVNAVRYCFNVGSFYVKWFVHEGDHVNAVRYYFNLVQNQAKTKTQRKTKTKNASRGPCEFPASKLARNSSVMTLKKLLE